MQINIFDGYAVYGIKENAASAAETTEENSQLEMDHDALQGGSVG
jgi:hypothetical protein